MEQPKARPALALRKWNVVLVIEAVVRDRLKSRRKGVSHCGLPENTCFRQVAMGIGAVNSTRSAELKDKVTSVLKSAREGPKKGGTLQFVPCIGRSNERQKRAFIAWLAKVGKQLQCVLS
jgi:hypothetical protein